MVAAEPAPHITPADSHSASKALRARDNELVAKQCERL